MRASQLTTVLAWSLGSMLVALAVLLPQALIAVDPPPVAGLTLLSPKLQAGAAELSVTLVDPPSGGPFPMYRAGQKVTLELTAVNTAEQPMELAGTVTLLASAASPMSRVVMPSKSVYQRDCTIALSSREKKTLRIEVDAALPPGNTVRVSLASPLAKFAIEPVMFTIAPQDGVAAR